MDETLGSVYTTPKGIKLPPLLQTFLNKRQQKDTEPEILRVGQPQRIQHGSRSIQSHEGRTEHNITNDQDSRPVLNGRNYKAPFTTDTQECAQPIISHHPNGFNTLAPNLSLKRVMSTGNEDDRIHNTMDYFEDTPNLGDCAQTKCDVNFPRHKVIYEVDSHLRHPGTMSISHTSIT